MTCSPARRTKWLQMAKINLADYLDRLDEPVDREAVASRGYQNRLFAKYAAREENLPEKRAGLLVAFRAGEPLTGPKGLRKRLGAIDLEYFGRAYLPQYFVRESPAFHGELDGIWSEGVMKGKAFGYKNVRIEPLYLTDPSRWAEATVWISGGDFIITDRNVIQAEINKVKPARSLVTLAQEQNYDCVSYWGGVLEIGRIKDFRQV